MVYIPAFIADIFLVYATIKFGPREWKHSPLVANNFVPVIIVSAILGLWCHYAFLVQFRDTTDATFWAGFDAQVLISYFSIVQLLTRGSTRGHSWGIWLVILAKVARHV